MDIFIISETEKMHTYIRTPCAVLSFATQRYHIVQKTANHTA